MNTLQLMRAIRNIPTADLRWRERLVLLCLALRCDQRLICWPSVRRLADDCGLSPSSTSVALAELERRQLIRRWWHNRTKYTAIKPDSITALIAAQGATIPLDGTVPANGIEDPVRRNRGSRETVQKNKRKRQEEPPPNPPTSGGAGCAALSGEIQNTNAPPPEITATVPTRLLEAVKAGNLPQHTTATAADVTAAYLTAYRDLTGSPPTDALHVSRWLRLWRRSGLTLSEYTARLSAAARSTSERIPTRVWTTAMLSAEVSASLSATDALTRAQSMTTHYGIEEPPEQHGATIWRWHADDSTNSAIGAAVAAAGGYGATLDSAAFVSAYSAATE